MKSRVFTATIQFDNLSQSMGCSTGWSFQELRGLHTFVQSSNTRVGGLTAREKQLKTGESSGLDHGLGTDKGTEALTLVRAAADVSADLFQRVKPLRYATL